MRPVTFNRISEHSATGAHTQRFPKVLAPPSWRMSRPMEMTLRQPIRLDLANDYSELWNQEASLDSSALGAISYCNLGTVMQVAGSELLVQMAGHW